MPIHGYPGGVITANPVAPTSTVATGVWTTEQQLQAVSQGNWPFTIPTQQISRSLRFNSADSAYLSRAVSTTGNRQKWTYSGWVKKSTSTATNIDVMLFGAGPGNSTTMTQIRLDDANGGWALWMGSYNGSSYDFQTKTTALFRDPSAWYHIVVTVDTTQATAADRIKLYSNGVLQARDSSNPSLNYNTYVNLSSYNNYIGAYGYNVATTTNGYMTEINFIDGQALTPSSFGQTNASTGVWEPINYTGTYGTNGFYVNFSDNSNTTAATLGKDYSGNGNNFTPNNFSVTAGAGNDSMVDSPTSYGTDTGVGGEVRGNYCTINPLENPNSFTLTNGNLDMGGSNAWRGTRATMGVSSGKWYWEYVRTSATSGGGTGISNATYTWAQMSTSDPGTYAGGYVYIYNGQKGNNNSYVSYGASFGQNDVIGVAFDADNGTLTFYKNGASQGTAYSGLTSGPYFPTDAGPFGGCTYNFGQRAFAYTAPSGFKALCTQNLPTPTIGATSTTQANDYFDATLYTGNGANNRTISSNLTPDFVWMKDRTNAYSHILIDSVRGTGKYLRTNGTNEENWDGNIFPNSGPTTNGFIVDGVSNVSINANGDSYVGWQWKANGAGSSNTSGSITSTVSANTTSGFSIVTYTGTGANATVGHGLGVAPSMVIVKRRNGTGNWCVYSASLTSAAYTLFLETTDAQAIYTNVWNSTAPTSTVFSVGNSLSTNSSSQTYVAYCFAPVAGYSAFGSYTGNGSTDGPFVYTGFRPRWIMFKRSDGVSAWELVDTARSTYNVMGNVLFPNYSNAEATTGDYANLCDALSNGFKIRSTSSASNSGTVIYAAFAEFPFKYSLAR